jgi:dihydropyrimidinase
VIDWMTKQLEHKKLFAPKYHITSHPPVAEIEATYRAISLSSFIDVPILIVHVSSPAAAAHISEAQKKGLPVYAETCPQYLFLTRKDLDKPGFEGEQDHDAIWHGLQNGTFTVLSSDHCPFIYDDNQTGKN